MDWEERRSTLSSPQSKQQRASPLRSPLLPPPPPSSHSPQSPQSSSSISSSAPVRISSERSSSPLELTGPKNQVVSAIITSSTASSLLSPRVTEAGLKLDHHHHRNLQQFHSQKFPNSTTTTSLATTIKDERIEVDDDDDENGSSCAVDLRRDQPEAASSSSLSSIAGQQKLNQLQGVPSSSAPSSSTLLARRRSREVVKEEIQDNPTDLTTKTTTTTSQQHFKNSRNLEECGGGSGSSSAEKPLSIARSIASLRRSKIPPPLDLSIGSPNLSLHNHSYSISSSNSNSNGGSSSSNAAHHSSNQQNHNPHTSSSTSPTYLGSPKFDNKNLPIRKRYQQWSPPTQMNGQELAEGAVVTSASSSSSSSSSGSSMMPLYSDSQQHNNPLASKTGLAGVGNAAGVTTSAGDNNNGTSPSSAGLYNRSWVLDMVPQSAPPITSSSRLNHHHHHHHHHGISLASSNSTNSSSNSNNTSSTNSIPNSLGLHTPTPFYTPNEPSPKFMNSPVFTYSNPDAPLYQGPFSPIRPSSLYPPPSSPFTNLSLNSPLPPLQSSVSSNSSSISSNSSTSSTSSTNNSTSTPSSAGGGGMVGNTCFNMIPSTLLSPAPSQASTNSLSYEDLHEKSLSLFTPVWSIFMPGTKVRFVGAINSMDWYLVDFLAQSGDSLLGLKGEYAPHGLELRKLVLTSSPKERVQLTFCPVADPNHPTIEVNCEPGHPFMVDKKGWCAVKPEVFQETYGSPCQALEGGDICLNLNAARSPNNNVISMNNNNAAFLHQQQQQQQHHQSLLHHTAGFVIHGSPNNVTSSAANLINNNSIINTSGMSLANMHALSQIHSGNNASNNNNNLTNSPVNSLMNSMKMEPIDEKPIPISVLPQNQHGGIPMQIMQSPPPPPLQHQQGHHLIHPRSAGGSGVGNSRKTSAAVAMSAPGSPAKRSKDGHAKDGSQTGDQPAKGRRPMNAFLLFAKDKRPELIQKFPGKDNRTISVLLGEAWQKLAAPERERYALNAKARAEEQKRIHPDCWKRKRSQSTSS